MWIPPVCVFTLAPIQPLDPEAIYAGIEQRLALVTSLFCPDEEEEPDAVLRRLRIEAAGENELKIRWRPRMRYPTRLYQFCDELSEQTAMAESGLRFYSEPKKSEPLRILKSAIDGAGFLQAYDRGNMGWPIVMAVAATLVERAGGVIVTSGFGWFVPSGNEVRWILKPEHEDTIA